MRARAFVSCLLVLALLSSGCGNRKAGQGAGTTVDFCAGYFEYSSFSEPVPTDASEMENYASEMIRVIDRIKLSFRVKLPKGPSLVIPPAVGDDLKILRAGLVRLRDDVRAAHGDASKVRVAGNRLMQDNGVTDADNRLVDFATARCPTSSS